MLKKGFGNFIMNNDKEFLATEPIEKLLLRLAIPTLAAQMINMLYNIIDRIYIGHIPGSGALALTGVGVCMPLIMIISTFAALVGNGGAPRASILMGKKDLDSAENILGNCFTMQIIISVILTLIMFFGNRTFLMAFGASENTIEYAFSWHDFCTVNTWNECVYHGTGICKDWNVFCFDRGCDQYYSRSNFYLCMPYGCSWCCTGYDHFSGLFLYLGVEFLIWAKIYTSYQETAYAFECSGDPALSGSWAFPIYHAGK